MVNYHGLQDYGPKGVQFRSVLQVVLIFGLGMWLLHQIIHPHQSQTIHIENLQNLFSRGFDSEFSGRKGRFGFLIGDVLEFPDENALMDDEGSWQTQILDDVVDADPVNKENMINAVEEADGGTKGRLNGRVKFDQEREVTAEGGGSGGDADGSDDSGFVFHDENGPPPDVDGGTGVYPINDNEPAELLRQVE